MLANIPPKNLGGFVIVLVLARVLILVLVLSRTPPGIPHILILRYTTSAPDLAYTNFDNGKTNATSPDVVRCVGPDFRPVALLCTRVKFNSFLRRLCRCGEGHAVVGFETH